MKRGQTVIEFLVTYGWMLFIVIAVIAALILFGVLDPNRLFREHCILPSGLACKDFYATADEIDLVVQNQLGFDILNITAALDGEGCRKNATGASTLLNGEQSTYLFDCAAAKGKYQGIFTVVYTSKQTGETHTKLGDVVISIP